MFANFLKVEFLDFPKQPCQLRLAKEISNMSTFENLVARANYAMRYERTVILRHSLVVICCISKNSENISRL